MSVDPNKGSMCFRVEGQWLYVKPEDIHDNKVRITEYTYEGYALKQPYTREIEIKKPLDQRITEYLDRCGVLNDGMRRDITAMIKEEERE